MSSPSTSLVSSTAESIDSASPISQAGEPWLPEPEELPTTPWYKEKTSTLREPDRDGSPVSDSRGERMGKAELLRAMQEAADAPPKKSTKRKAPSMGEKEARGEKRKKAGASTSGARTEEAPQPKQAPPPPTLSSEEALDAPPVVAWGGEMVKRLTKAHQKMNASRDQFDKAMGQHAEVLARLEELETLRSREKEAAAAQREALEAQLLVEREAHEAEKADREMLEAELEEVKSRAARDAERLKLEGKEEFLKSPEFDTLLGKKTGGFFKNGFLGCVAQWRANGYSEEEHPASFLNVQQAIAEMPDEEEEDGDEEEGGVGSEDTPPSSPLS
ncbi:hypothetical protein F511_29554 [Dorcoceras hygrometricum]|uniref:Uncharacterized protein n=1 Tax=Dorcoceras hygrometricum TaxID=472368 RepID=A0A2Z7DFT0_9LAMI|nr:hypothetical protein F511_29554 [Dorcoceras hygrometricum]